jgi:UDP-N-acetylmuramoylalanine--D-glutamate ligase
VTTTDWLLAADRFADWSGVSATVAGLGDAGFAAADALLRVGATVTVIDRQTAARGGVLSERSQILDALGAHVHLEVADDWRVEGDLLVPSPGLQPSHPWVSNTQTPAIWSGEQLAWQLRSPQIPWLTVTGTNGKTTTVQLIDQMLNRAGFASIAAGNIGRPMAEAVFAEPAPAVYVVELSSFQLHFTPAIAAHTAALLNIAPDHVDWHGSLEGYVADKARIYHGTERVIVYNRDDRQTEELAETADVLEGCRAVGFTAGIPARAMVGIVDNVIVDRAFVAERATHAVEVVSINSISGDGPGFVANVLAATAVARSFGVGVEAVAETAKRFQLDAHRGETVATVLGVRYVDNSKATNTHAADAALTSEASAVWIAGGLPKGAEFDQLFRAHRSRLRAVVLIGTNQDLLADAARRHAPDVPVIAVPSGETDPMDHAVRAAAGVARPGDAVLLAPACASMDQFADYRARGRAFVAAVARLQR